MVQAARASIPSLYPVSGGTGPAPSCGEQSPPAAVGGLPGLPEVGLQARPHGARGCWGEPWVRTPVPTFIQLLAPSMGVIVGELSQQSRAAGVGAAGFFRGQPSSAVPSREWAWVVLCPLQLGHLREATRPLPFRPFRRAATSHVEGGTALSAAGG